MSTAPNLYASKYLHWPTTLSNIEAKQEVAARAAAQVRGGEVVGIGSGSSAYLVLLAIGERVQREGLDIAVVTSSYETEVAADRFGIRRLELGAVKPLWGVDGADEVDPDRRLLKGRGGAMYKERILWQTSEKMFLAVDASKYVERLGQKFSIPVEVERQGVDLVGEFLTAAGATRCELRVAGGKDGPVITESGNLILDAWMDEIPLGFSGQLKALPGVVETGLFEGYEFEIL